MQNSEAPQTVIAEDVEVVGSIKCASDVRIDGKLNGDLSCNGNAVLGNTASVKGNIGVESVSIAGQVNGNITAKDRIELKATARINGDIRAKRLTVEDGVSFVGKSEVNPSGPSAPRNQPASEGKGQSQDRGADTPEPTGDSEERSKTGFFSKK